MNPFTFHQYEKISDDLDMIGPNTIIRFNVVLSRKGEDGKRYSFHKEYQYRSEKYNENLITIRRHFDYYLTIENIKATEFGVKEYIIIGLRDMYYFKESLKTASQWFISKQFEKLYVRNKEKKLVMLGKAEPIVINGLVMDKYITLEPIIYINERLSYGVRGVRMYLSSDNNFVDMTVDTFMEIVYLVDSLNMYQSAQLMVNYLQRPEYGTNIYTFSGANTNDEGFVDTKNTNRKIQSKRPTSFFDKMDNL